ncbi:MAG: ATP-binding protein [Vulcanimicrobiaceae bacterium]
MAHIPTGPRAVENRMLERLFEITQDILQAAHDIDRALESIARGLGDLFGFKYVSIVASDTPGGELYRRVLVGFPHEIAVTRHGEHIPRAAILTLLAAEYQAVPNCYYIPAECDDTWAYNIYTGDLPLDAQRSEPNAWHERDSLTLVLADRSGEMLGYVSVDGPADLRVPSEETLRQMQLFVNLVGLALTNARAHQAEIERRKLLEETSRAQNEFFGKVSHEVRSPLAAIRGATLLLEEHFDSLTPERRGELLHMLGSSTARLSAIFEDFLLLSRMDAGKLTLRLEPVDPIAAVEESVARTESEHPHREFRTLYLEPLPSVHADEGRLVQVLTNLLSNAAKYACEGSVVVTELRSRGGTLRFAVKNEGPGFTAEEREALFTRFGRLSATDDASTGLGLYICAELVNLMGGSIGCESEPGRITTFWFTLPRAGS